MLIVGASEDRPRTADLRWEREEIILCQGEQVFRAPLVRRPNGEVDWYATLADLDRMARDGGWSLVGCASCARFRFSGMSYQMSAGRAGYCGLVGYRNDRGVVEADHACAEHVPVEGWPDDLDVALEARQALSDREPRPTRLAAYEGALVGLAVGDALGFPTEFRRRAQIVESFGPAGVTDFVAQQDKRWPKRPAILGRRHPPGTYSDDTQMSLAVAMGLLDAGREDLDGCMEAVGRRFVEWSQSPDNDRAPGETCMKACEALARGVPWREARVTGSKGCGAAMRTAPIGLYYAAYPSRVLEVARASSLLTHGHDAAVEGAAATALLTLLALEKRTPEQMYLTLEEECAKRSKDFARCLKKVPDLLDADPAVALSKDGIGEGWVAEEAVASALWCFWRSPADFEATVLAAVNTDGDSDSIGCIAGAISGAFNGIEAIPKRWREGVENASMLRDLARRLWQSAPGRDAAP